MKKITEAVEYVIEPAKRKIFDLNELWQYRELFYFFSWRDLKVKYKQTVLGIAWVVLQPIVTVAIFSLFFGRALNTPSEGLPYPVFVFSGLLLWNLFSSSVNTAGNSMLTNASIIKKIYFPRVILPVSSVLISCVDFLFGFIAFLFVMIFYNIDINIVQLLVCWPLSLLLTLLGTTGVSCWLAALNVKYRDFRYVIPFGLQIALFVSPVIYPVSIVANGWTKYILAINPMYAAIMLFRAPMIGFGSNTFEILISAISAFLFFICGIYYFKKTEDYFADIA